MLFSICVFLFFCCFVLVVSLLMFTSHDMGFVFWFEMQCLFKYKMGGMSYPSGFDGVHVVSVGGSLGGRVIALRKNWRSGNSFLVACELAAVFVTLV